jgi:hypothetical protein
VAHARAVRRARPSFPVEVVDISERPVPHGIVGTPTYLLGERVVALGNPELVDLLSLVDTAAAGDEHE